MSNVSYINGEEPNNVDRIHALIQQIERIYEQLVNVAREEFSSPDLNGHDRHMVDHFVRGLMQAGHGVKMMHGVIDQNFEPITEEDVMAAFRQRRGLVDHGPQPLEAQPDTVGEVPLSSLPDWNVATFDPGSPEQRREQNRPAYQGRHRFSNVDLSVSPTERGEIT